MQHQVTVVSSKEDDFQRRLFEREQEIKGLREENQHFREQVEHQSQIIQVKSTETGELTEDIQTLARENKFVNSEFTKATQANEFLKRQCEQLQDQERLAQQSVRALEMEKQDVLQNYRDSCAENERHQDTIKQMQGEQNELYRKYLDLEKSMGGSSFAIKELRQKEQNYIAEIKTLERHLDHLTHQLELAHKAMRELEEHKDKQEIEINNYRAMNQNIENSQAGLQRLCSQLEQDKLFMQQQVNDLKVEAGALEQQLSLEKQKLLDLEHLIQQERRQNHDSQFSNDNLHRRNQELTGEVDRLKLRVQSLQSHIDTLQRYGPSRTNGGPGAQPGADQALQEELNSAH